jgi:tRNA(Ile)-lysidine synthase
VFRVSGDQVIGLFRKSLQHLLPENPKTREPEQLTIALSGGSDSLALLHLTNAAFPDTALTTLTVDHGLRIESAQEAEQVAGWMKTLKIPHHILRWHPPTPFRGNLQAAARKARYHLMLDFCRQKKLPILLLGHTKDDQAETIALMQSRGAGPVGLAGMTAKREEKGITLLRPLLNQQRSDLQSWLSEQNIPWISDPSNENEDFDRIRLRKMLQQDPAKKEELLALGKEMAKERVVLEQAHEKFISQYVTPSYDNVTPSQGGVLTENHLPRDRTPSCDGVTKKALTLPLAPLLALPESQAAHTLGRILCHTASRDYPPRYAKRLNLLSQITEPDFRQTTLHHCLIQRNKNTLIFTPEHDSIAFGGKPLVPSPFVSIFPE